MLVAGRSILLARMFNVRQGMDSKDDKLFRRMFDLLPQVVLKGEAINGEEFQRALKLYYAVMNWDEIGVPSIGAIYNLSLDWLI